MDDEHDFELICPFWIDTDAYTDRDRAMFVAGYEFADLVQKIRHERASVETTIHRENESRIRMLCSRFGRKCSIESCKQEHDPNGEWSYLKVEAV